jgi:hypothetical protein
MTFLQTLTGSQRSVWRLLLVLCFATMPGLLMAQLHQGAITGSVTDPQGAAVAHATVQLTNIVPDVRVSTRAVSRPTLAPVTATAESRPNAWPPAFH